MKNILFLIFYFYLCITCVAQKTTVTSSKTKRPNIIVIMADDMGFSDIGCYGGEIPTPNIDALANGGVRLSQFYNNGRCCPTRASLLTGLYPHQTGVGAMAEDPEKPNINDEGVSGYRGFLSKNTVTIAEVLKASGYHTYMAGKWHVGMHSKDKRPLGRGFEKYYGILSGGSSYLQPYFPRGVTDGDGTDQYTFPKDYYTTDAFADHAVKYISEQKDGAPFFLYLAFTAPHWPLHAKEEDVKLFQDKYMIGWDSIRHERWRRQIAMGLVRKEWGLAERQMRPWNLLTDTEKKDVAYRMSVYAAQVYSMDQNIGKLIECLKKKGQWDNTLIMFLSDNGACAEPYEELGGRPMNEINNPNTFWFVSYGTGWANTSNTPFHKYKTQTYEGGISAPFIMHWPAKLQHVAGSWNAAPFHLIDIMATINDASKTNYPKTFKGYQIIKTEGMSMLPAVLNKSNNGHNDLYWEHEGHCAFRQGDWKLVKPAISSDWELYNLVNDRTERHNLASQQQALVAKMDKQWKAWANTHQVFPKGKSYKDNTSNHPSIYPD